MKNKEEQEQMFFHYLIRKIDKFGQIWTTTSMVYRKK